MRGLSSLQRRFVAPHQDPLTVIVLCFTWRGGPQQLLSQLLCPDLVARHLGRAAHPLVPASVSSPNRKTPRPLKPRTPNDCPVCGRPHSTPLWGNPRKPGVIPWSECQSLRGRPKTICTAGYACPNPDCDYHGNLMTLLPRRAWIRQAVQVLICLRIAHHRSKSPKTVLNIF